MIVSESISPKQRELLEEAHQLFLQTEIEEVDLYDTKGEYVCTEVREPKIN